jgi:hypothetical protein
MMEARREGKIRGLKVCNHETISHVLFIDDILCFARGEESYMLALKGVLYLYCKATSMMVNYDKYNLY